MKKLHRLFHAFNRIVARLRGAEGWCYAGYQFARYGLPEDDEFQAIPPQNRISAWWGAFMFKYRSLEE